MLSAPAPHRPSPSLEKRHRTLGRRVQPGGKGLGPPRQGAGQKRLREPTEPSSITPVPGLLRAGAKEALSLRCQLPLTSPTWLLAQSQTKGEEEKEEGGGRREEGKGENRTGSFKTASHGLYPHLSPSEKPVTGYLPETVTKLLQFGFTSILNQKCVLHLISYATVLDGN